MSKCSKWQLRQAVGELVHKEERMDLRGAGNRNARAGQNGAGAGGYERDLDGRGRGDLV